MRHGTQGYRLYMDGDMWCATDHPFVDLQRSNAGFGPTQQDAVDDLCVITRQHHAIENFEVGYWRRDNVTREVEWIPNTAAKEAAQ